MKDSIRVDGIDISIQIIFKSEHLKLLLPHLERAGILNNHINEMIDLYIKSGELVSYEKWILQYGQSVLNPLMNKNLGRIENHPTFNNLLKFALKDLIDSNPVLSQLALSKKKALNPSN